MGLKYQIIEKIDGFSYNEVDQGEYKFRYKRTVHFNAFNGQVLCSCCHFGAMEYHCTFQTSNKLGYKILEVCVKTDKPIHPTYILIKCLNEYADKVAELVGYNEIPDSVYNTY